MPTLRPMCCLVKVWIASTKFASSGDKRSVGDIPSNKGPAGSRPAINTNNPIVIYCKRTVLLLWVCDKCLKTGSTWYFTRSFSDGNNNNACPTEGTWLHLKQTQALWQTLTGACTRTQAQRQTCLLETNCACCQCHQRDLYVILSFQTLEVVSEVLWKTPVPQQGWLLAHIWDLKHYKASLIA